MIGRGALGRPWVASLIEEGLGGAAVREPDAGARLGIALDHLSESVSFHGDHHGLRTFRKHLSAYIDHAPWPAAAEARRSARSRLCRLESPGEVARALTSLWTNPMERLAA
jgi:tRNA-dihydrouridine synthase